MTQNVASRKEHTEKEPIAIIGIGCRYPGGVKDPQTFWKLLANGVDAISDIPADRVDVAPLYDPITGAPGRIASSQGGFLDKLDQFDASFFGVSPREAEYMDPQQRLLLEISWEALEDAGQVPKGLKESQTGVFVGMWTNDYTEKMYKEIEDINLYVTTGGGRYAASGRLSYFFGLQGPSLTVDTACSSSLVTVHLACQSLREGESDLALAGGVNLILEPAVSIGYSRSKMLSPDGRCKFGDASANGYVRSEGAGMIVLKRLSEAQADHDHIYAVIRGSAVNNDGRSSELLVAPGVGSQIKMLREAYRHAGVDPAQVGYVEAHGTGTPVGDPVELEALGTVLSENRDVSRACRIGSIKTNIGHTESASGVAGLIKVALSLEHKSIPPSLHFKNPNPKIPWKDLKLEMQTELTGWPAPSSPLIASVNSFGITGTNAHVVLEEAPRAGSERSTTDTFDSTYLLPISAQTPEALRSLVELYLAVLNEEGSHSLHDISYTASCRRVHHPQRLVVIGSTTQEWIQQLSLSLQQMQSDSVSRTQVTEHPKVAFVFPGQGAQWLGMGRELLQQNSVFCEVMTRCDQSIKQWADWSLLEQMSLSEDSPAYRLNEISVIQPSLFAMEVALAAVWQSWGIEASAVLGHSMGEVAAAYVAGALSLEDATHIICKRSQLMQRTSGQGAMAVVGLPFKEVEKSLQGYEGRLSVAVQNSPRSTVVAGDPDALKVFMERLHSREIFCRLIKVDVASHSPQMDPIRPELIDSLQGIQPHTATIPFYSTVTQDIYDGEFLDAEYWGRNLRQPVWFSETVQRLLEDEHVIFIEMSPHPILLSSIDETRVAVERTAYGVASLRRDQPELASLLGEVGSLYTLGYNVDWNKLYPDGEIVSLPTYPWQREHYWFETTASSKQTRPGAHPFLGKYTHSATGEHIWETAVSARLFPYLYDHLVRGSVVLPAAAYIELALAAASEIAGSKPCRIKDISFQEAFFLSTDEEKIFQLILTSDMPNAADFRVYSQTPQNDSWSLHASGTIEFLNAAHSGMSPDWKGLRSQPMDATANEFYDRTSQRGLAYGSSFQSIVGVTQQRTGILSEIKLSDEIIPQAAKYLLHPVLLDACFQTLLAALPDVNDDTYLPTSLENVETYTLPSFDHEFWCYAVPTLEKGHVAGDIYLFDENGQILLFVRQLVLQHLEAEQKDVRDLFYEIQWQESPIPAQGQSESGHWLIFADRQGTGDALAEKLRQNTQTCTLVSVGTEYRVVNTNHYELDPSRPEQFQRLLKDVSQPVYAIAHLWSLDQAATPTSTDSNVTGFLYLTQAMAQLTTVPRLSLVTRGTQSVLVKPEPVSVSQSSVWGMGAVIANEFPSLHCTRVDLSPVAVDGDIELLAQTLQVQDEDQVALRNRQRYAARLKQVSLPAANEAQNVNQKKVESHQSFQVDVVTPGILDSLSLHPVLRRAPKAGEVEIAVKATGLNFMNVMGAMGIYPGYPRGVGPLGIECAGVVVSVGEGVTDFHAGDEVAAIAFDSLASHAVTDARLVVKKPTFLSFEQAASIPIAYVTAYYALHYLGRLQANERVLIHSATGGVGLAAIQLAKRAGAEIFATAGNAEKREYLKALGIKHVMDSRSLSFADVIMQVTNGEGVDLVLNSLAGNAIAKGLQVLRTYGRFLEIGKSDIYQNSKIGLLPFKKNLSYFAIDLDKASHEKAGLIGGMLREIFELIESRQLTTLPLQTFPVSQVSNGFRMMAQARHIGKIAITMEDPNASFDVPADTTPIRADGTYLITGGLGDLGLTFARWLAKQGAGHLVLLGRSKPSESARQVVDELRESGVNVVTAQADVTNLDQLSSLFAQIKQDLPPLKGVIHAAGLLADSTIPQMDGERFMQAYAPKVLGAWNLHTLTVVQPLDFFILFSSVAAVLGTPGQVNYAAGNSFLDALARSRHAQGLPALSINWGPWSEIGLAAELSNRGARLTQQGLRSISPEQGVDTMSMLMAQKKPHVSVMWLDAAKWCSAQPAAIYSSLFKDLLTQNLKPTTEKKSVDRNIREELIAVAAEKDRRTMFETYLRDQVAQVLHLAPARIALDKPLRTLGMDSLMSIELRNRLEDGLHLTLAASLIWNYPTVHALTTFLAEKIDVSLEKDGSVVRETPFTTGKNTSDAEIENLSKNELDALLKEEMDAIEDLLGDE